MLLSRHALSWLLGPLLLAAALMSGCQPAVVPSEAAAAPAVLAVDPTETIVRPVLVATIAAPGGATAIELPAFVATATPLPSPTPLPFTPEATGTPEPSPTPQPTFTPPALPNTPANEHYWFRRPIADGGVVWTDKVYPYGSTRGGTLRPHHGVEFNVGYNTEILAAASGTVLVAGSDAEAQLGETPAFYGNVIVIEHDSTWNGQAVFTLYGHLNEVLVRAGERVDARQVIGLSGATGVADGPHLHFEVRVGQNSYEATRNPLLWLLPFDERGTVAGRVTWPDGSLATEVPISLHRIDAPTAAYYATTTYAPGNINSDDIWDENFAIDDVVAGYYEATIKIGEDKFTTEFWVFPYRTNFIELVIRPGAPEPRAAEEP